MCYATNRRPTLDCTLGNVPPGNRFYTPDGETWMVLAVPAQAGDVMVANLGNRDNNALRGMVTPMYGDTCLAREENGRLYASRALNGWYCDPDSMSPNIQAIADLS